MFRQPIIIIMRSKNIFFRYWLKLSIYIAKIYFLDIDSGRLEYCSFCRFVYQLCLASFSYDYSILSSAPLRYKIGGKQFRSLWSKLGPTRVIFMKNHAQGTRWALSSLRLWILYFIKYIFIGKPPKKKPQKSDYF